MYRKNYINVQCALMYSNLNSHYHNMPVALYFMYKMENNNNNNNGKKTRK